MLTFTIAIVASLIAGATVLWSEGSLSPAGWTTIASNWSLLILHPLGHWALTTHTTLILLRWLLLIAVILASNA